MTLYNWTESLDGKTTFLYVVIFLTIIWYFRDKQIGLNMFMVLIISYVVISYIYQKQVTEEQLETTQINNKHASIRPVDNKLKNHTDLIDFFFSVQDFYRYNPQTYEECIDNIDVVLQIYDIIFTGTDECYYYYEIADTKKNNALNSFHSLIYKLPNDKTITDKFNRAHKRLETILNKYINEMYSKCEQELLIKSYDINTKLINTGPTEYNNYVDNHFQVY